MDFANWIHEPKLLWLNLGLARQPSLGVCDSAEGVIWSFQVVLVHVLQGWLWPCMTRFAVISSSCQP